MDGRAVAFLDKVACRIASRNNQDIASVKPYVYGRVSSVLHRSIARSVLKRCKDTADSFSSSDSREFTIKSTLQTGSTAPQDRRTKARATIPSAAHSTLS